MNKIIFTIALLLLSMAVRTQNWEPFTAGESHHYRSDTGTWIEHTIHIDSITHDGNGPVWHFPRLMKVFHSRSALGNMPHFCQRILRIQGNGRYQFFDPGNISLDAHAGLGGVALVDSLGTATGLVTHLYSDSVLGEADSLKVIALTTGDSLVLSKNHGLVEWPASLGPHRYFLVGLQSRHLGDTLPGWAGFFQYKAGDEYCWRAGGASYDYTRPQSQQFPPWYRIFKLKIMAAIRDSVGLHLVIASITQDNGFDPVRDTTTIHIPDLGTGWPVVGPGEIVTCGEALEPYFFPGAYSVWNAYCADYLDVDRNLFATAKYIHRNDTTILSFTNEYPFWYDDFGTLPGDSLTDYYLASESIEFAEGLGFTHTSATAIYQTCRYTWGIHLTGYVRDGDTVGTVWPDEEPRPESEKPDLTIWPNPTAGNTIHLTTRYDQGGTLHLSDRTGRLVGTYSLSGSSADLPVEGLRPGIYNLRYAAEDTVLTRRLVIVR